MKNLNELNHCRDREAERDIYGETGNHNCGLFRVRLHHADLVVIASVGAGWDHVSASLRDRCPTWAEMDAVKRMFFKDDETAMQLHVPPSDHINAHPYALHLWRPLKGEIPRPPGFMVGPKS